MERKSILTLVALIIMLVIFASSVLAQPRQRRFKKRPGIQQTSSIGARFGNDFKNDQYFVGGQFRLPVGIFWRFTPSADYYFTDNDSKRWQFNGDLIFKPRPFGPLFLGGGVAVQYLTLDKKSDVGGNALVGLEFIGRRLPVMTPYIQARWTFLPHEQYFSLLAGINFILR